MAPAPDVIALFGPTAVGKTGVAIELAELLRGRGEDPVAVNCDSIQLYRGLEVLSGAASPGERERLEHRLLAFVDPSEEFSAGRYAELAHAEIDSLLAQGRRPIVVGGTGLYLRAALSDLGLKPPVPEEVRAEVEAEIERRGAAELHAELPPELAGGIEPNDRKRVARLTELRRAGMEPHATADELWSTRPRRPTVLFGLVMDRGELARRIDERVEAMIAAGAEREARAADEAGASRTARAALGFQTLLEAQDAVPSAEQVESIKTSHRRYARRQQTWMRKLEGVNLIDRTGMDDVQVARRLVEALDSDTARP